MFVIRNEIAAEQRRSHYHLADTAIADQCCQGLACFVAQGGKAASDGGLTSGQPPIYCLGKCYAAPARGSDNPRPHVAIDASAGIVLERIATGGARTLTEYAATGGYSILERQLRRPPVEILDELERSGLRGRGGAGFPTAKKWRAVASQAAPEKHLVVNADEGDPGAYIDRFIMEDDPHVLIEASVLAGHAIGANRGTIYLRKEYPQAWEILAAAIREARNAGLLGAKAAGTDFAFELDVFQGQGSYVCGEETALLNSLEGTVPMVRVRPPYPTEHGLFGKPTLVNNVETLANIPWILRHGGSAYRALGFGTSCGTKVVSLNSLFRRPGLYEVEFGVSVRHIVENLGGGVRSGEIRGLLIGGPLAGILPPQLFDTLFDFEALAQVGASVGHGGVVAFDERTSLVALMQHVFAFAAAESCGKCTPCRIGARTVAEFLGRALQGDIISPDDRLFARDIIAALAATSLCGLGTGLADFARSALRYYPQEVADAFGEN